MVKVSNEIRIYAKDGIETNVNAPKLKINSHWRNHELIILEFETENIVVSVSDLKTAINNAANIGK